MYIVMFQNDRLFVFVFHLQIIYRYYLVMAKSLKSLTRIYDMLKFSLQALFTIFLTLSLASALDRETDVALASISHEQTH